MIKELQVQFKKTLIASGVIVAAGAASLGIMAPAAFAASPATDKAHATVTIDKAHEVATFTTKKGAKLTVRWEEFAGGKRDLVTVRNADKKLVAARTVGDARLEKALVAAEKHPGALRHLWVEHHKQHGEKKAAKK